MRGFRANISAFTLERLSVEGFLRGKRAAGFAADRISRQLNGHPMCGGLGLEITRRLGRYWRVDVALHDSDPVCINLWLTRKDSEKVEREYMRRGGSLAQVNGHLLTASFEGHLPNKVSGVVDKLKIILPERSTFDDPLPDGALDIVFDLRAAIAEYEKPFAYRSGRKLGRKRLPAKV